MPHHTKNKGDYAVIKTIADLTEKGFDILTPLVCEHLPFDIAGYRNEKFFRFQVKYSTIGKASARNTWSDKNGCHCKEYKENDFDYYAIYLPNKNVVCYPSIKFAGIQLCSKVPNSANSFYWYEDFLDLTDNAKKKNFRDFGIILSGNKNPRPEQRKVKRPTKEELTEILWLKPMRDIAKDFGVSDKTIAKWAKTYEIETPKQGYWILNNK